MTKKIALLVVLAGVGASQSRPTFEVASVKLFKDDGGPRNSSVYGPQGVNFGGRALAYLIGEAYDFPVGRIVGPGSLTKQSLWGALQQGYDIVARADHPVPRDQLRLMLQSLLAERFQLAVHRESKTGPVYRLVVARDGPKLDESAGGDFGFSGSPDGYVFRNAEMQRLSGFLSGQVDRIVIDRTGLKGLYNFTLKKPGDPRQDSPGVKSEGFSPDSQSGGIFAEALKQLGLQLIADRAPVEYLVVDRVEKPTEN